MLIAEVVPLQDLLRLGFSALLVAMAKDSSAFSRLCDRYRNHFFPRQILIPDPFQHIAREDIEDICVESDN
jgi:hypothetical protein